MQERIAHLESLIDGSQVLEGASNLEESAVEFSKQLSNHFEDTEPLKLRRTILWVDDYPRNNAFLVDKLQRDGFDVRTELSTVAALRAHSQQEYFLVITDMGREESGVERPSAGLELIMALRSSEYRGPILVFSGARTLLERERLLKAGANEVTSSAVEVFKFVDTELRKAQGKRPTLHTP